MHNLKIITAGNDSYILTLLDFINCFFKLNMQPNTLIVYDIGLNNENKTRLLELHNKYDFELKTLDYNLYPEHVNVYKYNGLYCSYAFKPIIIHTEANCINNQDSILIWMDSANRFDLQVLNCIYNSLTKIGFYSPYSNYAGTIESIELNHPSTVNYFRVTEQEHKTKLFSISANLVGVNYSTKEGKYILDKWYNSSLIKDVIMPEGSSRNNHRQDQTLLSVIMYSYEKENKMKFNYQNFGVKYWNKLDKSTVQEGNYPFGLFKKQGNYRVAIIFCNNINDAIQVYIKRKMISVDEFNTSFYVSPTNC
jgi:hypothetical protein